MPKDDELLTRSAYDTVADVYADHIRSTEPENPLELAMIDHFVALVPAPRRVLDAGCGAGRMLPHLAARGCQPEGIDLSGEMIRRAHLDHPEFPCRVGSLTAVDEENASFDGVFSWYSTIHNPDEDLDTMLTEMSRVLRPGGALLVAFQVGSGMRRVGQAFERLGHDIVMHRYHRSPEDMTARLRQLGLDVVARLERGPMGAEVDPQAFLVARKPQA